MAGKGLSSLLSSFDCNDLPGAGSRVFVTQSLKEFSDEPREATG